MHTKPKQAKETGKQGNNKTNKGNIKKGTTATKQQRKTHEQTNKLIHTKKKTKPNQHKKQKKNEGGEHTNKVKEQTKQQTHKAYKR